MLGGYQIIDLRKIGLELKGSQQTISDAGILNQLRGLRAYIEKSHAYDKALNNSMKPIMIRYRDQKNDEKREVSSFASINSTNQSLTFTIESKHLQIEVVFEEKTDDDGNKYYDIKTAKYLYSLDELIEGDLSIGGDLDVDGDASIDGDVSVGGDLTVTGSINGEENPSVKPIYCHPIHITNAQEAFKYNIRVSCLIFNNDDTPFTKSSLKQLLLTTNNIRLVITGGCYVKATEKTVIASYIYENNDTLYLMGIDTAGNIVQTIENINFGDVLDDTNTNFADSPNKIN